ncbi:MAG: polysaccharide deacetylase family protein [Syntrophobacteraceae bacterium]
MEGASRLRYEIFGLNASYMPRQYSSVWKAPLPGWKGMLDEVSAKMASTGLPPIFFRADDIGAAGKAFDALCGLFRFYQVPLAMAVIPAWLGEARQERLFQAAPVNEELWNWHQHGWRHINWQKDGEKCEFGSDRAPERQHEDILQGRIKMERIFGRNFVEVFTPPWNGFSTAALSALRKLGFKGISVMEPFPAGIKFQSGIQHLPVRLALHTRKAKDPAADFALLIDQFRGISTMKGLTGIMIHHQRMTPFAFEFLERMIYNLKYVIKARFCSFREMLNSPNEKQAVARLR